MTLTIPELEGCYYSVDGEVYEGLENAVATWMDKGTGYHTLQAWRDEKLVARMISPRLGWQMMPFPPSKDCPY